MTARIAIAGTGYIADYHARAVAAAGARLVAVTNHRRPSLTAFAQRHGGPHTYDRLTDLLDRGDVDGLVVATPNALHAEQTTAALAAGTSVLLEKPMAMTAGEAAAIAATESRGSARVMLAHCLRFDDQVRWLRDRVAEGAVGRPIRVTARAVHTGFGPGGWFTDPALAGGGALMDLGVHAIDAARFVLGDPTPVSVFATTATLHRDLAVDDTATVVVRWSDATVTHVDAGWWHAHDDGPVGRLCVEGTSGFAETFPSRLHSAGHDAVVPDDQPAELTEPATQRRYDEQMRAFVRMLDGAPATPGAADGLLVMRVVDAAYESARTGASVPTEEVR